MAWRNCEQYSLEKCGPGKPCQFNGPVNYHCSGRMLPVGVSKAAPLAYKKNDARKDRINQEKTERRDTMPRKKTKKKPVEKKARKTPVDQLDNVRAVSSAQELPEEPAISLVGRVEELLTDINQLHEQVNEQEQRVATLKDQLRDIKFDNGKLSVEFGWNEGPETPSVRVGVFADRGFVYTETSLEELGEMVEWCGRQLG